MTRPRLAAWAESAPGRRALIYVRWVLTAALLVFVAWRLAHIGWRDVLRAVPLTPATAALFVICYNIQPIADFLIYRRLWQLPASTLPAFYRKRALNEGVMDYSGELFLLDWGRRRSGALLSSVAGTVKDVNILSIISSHLLTLGVIIYVLTSGAHRKLIVIDPDLVQHMTLALIFVVGLLLMMVVLQRQVIGLPAPLLRFVLGIHAVRVIGFFTMSMALWSAAVPTVMFVDWFLFMAAQLLASRLPLVPNRDLVMASIGIALAPSLGSSATSVAGLFVGVSSAYLITNLVVVLLTQRLPAGRAPAVDTAQTAE